ncbi:MAG: hypothetical protein SFY32_05615 [Bacteroidota bacterium]|nr:hypothetical protein [Bacteroidota bacterium]
MRYHNLTSKYNAYFLARERLGELEKALYDGDPNNFYNYLNIYPKSDCTYAKGNKDKFDKIIKNASLPIQWHKPSHWVDDCYLVIGKIRFYDYDLENAVTTFRYINMKYNEIEVKHETLIWLMKTYMWMGDYDQAHSWGEYLENEAMSTKNLALLSLANGHYYIKQNEPKTAFLKLKVGVKYVKPRQYRAKIYYILGQLAQKIERQKDAYQYFKKCSKMTGNYEMWLYAKLNMYLMKDIKTDKDYEKIIAFYNKLLKDPKNKDYYDKIYYDMATVEYKRKRIPKTLDYYSKAVKNATKGTYVKAFAYLRSAEIYYDDLQKFELASKYYDSCITVLEKDLPEYPKAYKRQRILKEFVEQMRIIRVEDSLQRLARMDTAKLSKIIDGWIADEKAKLDDQEREQRRKARSLITMSEVDPTMGQYKAEGIRLLPGSENKWYFYNQEAMDRGKADFESKWGIRANEDNWRRSSKEKDEFSTAFNPQSGSNNSNEPVKEEPEKTVFSSDQKKQQYYDQLPLTKVKMDTSVAKLKRAMFKISRIFDQNLEEYPNAINAYNAFIAKYPDDEKTPEALYAIYLICKNKIANAPNDSCTSACARMLINDFSYSIYAKLVEDPDYLKKNKIKGERVKAKYRLAFEYYERDRFLESNNMITETMELFPESEYDDRLELLRCMIVGRTQSWDNYQDTLRYFIKKYEKRKSKLVGYAQNLLEGSKKVAASDSTGNMRKRINWDLDLNFPHLFCVASKNQMVIDQLVEKFKTYNNDFYTEEKLQISKIILEDSVVMLAVKQFPNKIQGMNYFEKQNGKSSPLKAFPDEKFDYFVISEKNFEILNNEKSFFGYNFFFQKNYFSKEF